MSSDRILPVSTSWMVLPLHLRWQRSALVFDLGMRVIKVCAVLLDKPGCAHFLVVVMLTQALCFMDKFAQRTRESYHQLNTVLRGFLVCFFCFVCFVFCFYPMYEQLLTACSVSFNVLKHTHTHTHLSLIHI